MKFQTVCARLAAYNCYVSGVSVKEIAKQAGKSPPTIQRWLRSVNPNWTMKANKLGESK